MISNSGRDDRAPSATETLSDGSVRIVEYGECHSGEALIDRVTRIDGRIRVELTLAAGGRGQASVDPTEWCWLDVRTGDIVAIRGEPADNLRL